MKKTPSPQSIAVPVEPTDEMMLAGALVGPDTNNGQFGYDDARTVFVAMLAAAPAPSSLAGGEVLKALLDQIDIQTCTHENIKRGGAIWTICEDCGRKWADDEGGFKPHQDAPAVSAARAYLAALSPEAPAREDRLREALIRMIEHFERVDAPEADRAVIQYASKAWAGVDGATGEDGSFRGAEWFGVTGAADETEALAVALFDARCPGIRMTDEDLHYYRAAAQRAMQAVADELDTPALTPRHEAPAALCDHGHTDPMALCSDCEAASDEASAEGAGEREEIARIMDPKGWETRDRQYEAIKRSTMHDKDRPLAFANADYYTRDSLTKADAIIALRARSFAPEAREGEAVAWRWRFTADAYGVDSATPGEWKYQEAREQVSAVGQWRVEQQPLYTHPAAPSADKLRIAVEALGAERGWHERVADFACDAAREASERKEKADEADAMRRMNAHNARVAIIDQALADLKAEGA